MNTKLHLSKSLYTRGLQCKKSLWLKKYKLLSLPVLYLIDLTVWFLSDERRQQAIEDLITKNINEQEDIDSGNLRVGADWMGGKLKSDRIEENNAKIKELQGENP